jgi:hypothetical protein
MIQIEKPEEFNNAVINFLKWKLFCGLIKKVFK